MFWRGVWGYLPAQIVQGVVGFLTIFVFTRLLSADDFGHYALAFSVTTLAHTVTFTWLEASMARFWAAERTPEGLATHFASLYRTSFAIIAVFTWIIRRPAQVAVADFGEPTGDSSTSSEKS